MPRFRTITAKVLREALADLDDDALVVFSSNYGDHGRTEQVHFLDGEIEERHVKESGYSESGFALVDQDDEPEEDAPTVHVIS